MTETKTLAEKIKEEFDLPESHIGHYCSDLHVLADDAILANKIRDFAIAEGWAAVSLVRADVEGHDWYRKRFVDIAFAFR
jgi:hypothetical protein